MRDTFKPWDNCRNLNNYAGCRPKYRNVEEVAMVGEVIDVKMIMCVNYCKTTYSTVLVLLVAGCSCAYVCQLLLDCLCYCVLLWHSDL